MDSERLRGLVRPEVVSLEAYVAGKSPAQKRGRRLKLASNENIVINGSDVSRYLRRVQAQSLSYYPDSHHVCLKEAVSEFLTQSGYPVSVDQIVLGDGSGESLQMVASTLLNAGERVVLAERGFSLYRSRVLLQGARIIEVPRRDFWVDLQACATVAREQRAKLVVFSNPDNPTSTFYPLEQVEKFLDGVGEDCLVLLDEAYIHFASWQESGLRLLSRYANLIVMHTLSKAFGLAALRVGFTVCHPLLAAQMEKIRLPFNLGVFAQEGARYRLKHTRPVWRSVAVIQRERQRLLRFLGDCGLSPLSAGGNFVFCDFGLAYKRLLALLEEAGITVRSLGSFGFEPRYVRITVGGLKDMAYFRRVLLRCLEIVSREALS